MKFIQIGEKSWIAVDKICSVSIVKDSLRVVTLECSDDEYYTVDQAYQSSVLDLVMGKANGK
jgi:hypothetical protein